MADMVEITQYLKWLNPKSQLRFGVNDLIQKVTYLINLASQLSLTISRITHSILKVNSRCESTFWANQTQIWLIKDTQELETHIWLILEVNYTSDMIKSHIIFRYVLISKVNSGFESMIWAKCQNWIVLEQKSTKLFMWLKHTTIRNNSILKDWLKWLTEDWVDFQYLVISD